MYNKELKVSEIQNLMHNFHTLPKNYIEIPSLLIKSYNESMEVMNEH